MYCSLNTQNIQIYHFHTHHTYTYVPTTHPHNTSNPTSTHTHMLHTPFRKIIDWKRLFPMWKVSYIYDWLPRNMLQYMTFYVVHFICYISLRNWARKIEVSSETLGTAMSPLKGILSKFHRIIVGFKLMQINVSLLST